MPWKIKNTAGDTLAESHDFFSLPLNSYFPHSGFSDAVNSDHTFLFSIDEISVGWEEPAPPVIEPETAAQARTRARYAIEAHIQDKASEYGFDSIVTAGYRAALPESPWHAIGKSLALWADSCWTASDALEGIVIAEMTAGTRTAFPDNAEIIAFMPAFIP